MYDERCVPDRVPHAVTPVLLIRLLALPALNERSGVPGVTVDDESNAPWLDRPSVCS